VAGGLSGNGVRASRRILSGEFSTCAGWGVWVYKAWVTQNIRLSRLAEAAGIKPRTVARWAEDGIIRGRNLGRGRDRGIRFTREQAIEVCAVLLLRRAGVPLQRLRATVRTLQSGGKHGQDFLAVGASGRTVLLDGRGDSFPLADSTGQTFLPLVLDLRTMRGRIERLVERLEQEEVERSNAD